jgi:hypothetical protein
MPSGFFEPPVGSSLKHMEDLNPKRLPSPQTTLGEMLSDRRAWTDGVITPLIFLAVNAVWGLRPAAIAAGAWGVGVATYRLLKRQQVSYALGGLFGLGIALLIALRTGRATAYFLPSVLFGAIYGTVGLVSVAIRRPVSAGLARLVEKKPPEWYRQPRVNRTHLIVTTVWSVFLLTRSAIRYYLISTDSEAGLAVTTVALGLPATALLVVATWAFIKRRLAPIEHL